MNKKTINKIIKSKIDKWLRHIDDIRLIKSIEKDIIVTGGCIVSMLMNEEVNDYDVYFKTKETALEVAKYYCQKFNDNNKSLPTKVIVKDEDEEEKIKISIESAGVAEEEQEDILDEPFDDVNTELTDIKEKPKYRPVYLSSNAITLSDNIQIVIRFYGEPDKIHENFDFVHCKNYWTYEGGVVLNQEALESILAKELIYSGSLYPVCSMIRTRKFIKRGWHINAGQYVKMCFQISKLDLTDIEILKEQLIGVDSAYFGMLIEALEDKKDKDKDFMVTEQYLITLIDRIF